MSQGGLEQQLAETQEKLRKLGKFGAQQLSRTDPDSRFLHQSGGFVLGYTLDRAASEDHLIVAQRTTQAVSDSESLLGSVILSRCSLTGFSCIPQMPC